MVYIILGEGFEPVEAIGPCDVLRRGGVEVKLAGIGGLTIRGGQNVAVCADCTVDEIDEKNLEMVVLPGGLGGVKSILGCETALNIVRRAYDADKFVAAICAGPTILAKLGITDGKKATCYPGCEGQMGTAVCTGESTACDGKVITGRAAGSALDFGVELLKALRGEEAAQKVAGGMVVK